VVFIAPFGSFSGSASRYSTAQHLPEQCSNTEQQQWIFTMICLVVNIPMLYSIILVYIVADALIASASVSVVIIKSSVEGFLPTGDTVQYVTLPACIHSFSIQP
jgi:hypothetical protein